MKRFLSLVLSALFVFQLGNASCDAASHYRSSVQNYNMGATLQGQPVIVMQPSPYPQQQPIINVTTPEPAPQHITIQQPEMQSNFNVRVDATTTADKITSVIKCAGHLFLAVGGLWLLVKFWPLLKFLLKNITPIAGAATVGVVASKGSALISLLSKVLKSSGIVHLFNHRGAAAFR